MASVTFPVSAGGDGSTVSDDASPTTGLANGGHRTRFVPALAQTVAMAGTSVTSAQSAQASATSALNSPGSQATSATSLTISTGSKAFTLAQTGKAFVVGQQVVIANTASPTNWMAGTITAFTAGTGAITVNVALISGSGTASTWTISQSGPALPVVLKAGDTMTGPLVLPGSPTLALEAATKGYVDGAYFRPEIQEFAISGTWTKPAGVTTVLVECWGAGGGGGSGNKNAAGALRGPGGGGGGGAYNYEIFKASDIGSSVVVTVGLGGTGGAAVTGTTTQGNQGTAGGASSFGSLLTAFGGGGSAISTVNGATVSSLGGGGTRSANAGTQGGEPHSPTLLDANDVQIFGGGRGGGTTGTLASAGQNSAFGGGGGGGSADGWQGRRGGFSQYGGAGGHCGGGISTGDTRQTLARSSNATGGLGSGGIYGLPGVYEVNSATFGSIAYGDGKFFMLSQINADVIYTSADGITWTKTALPIGDAMWAAFGNTPRIIHDGTQWVLVGIGTVGGATSGVYTLPNNFSTGWTLRAGLTSPRGIAFAGGTYVVVGDIGSIQTSTNLTNWTTQTSGTAQTLRDVIHDGTNWLVVGSAGVFLRSTNATSWTLVTTGSTGDWYRIASDGAGTLVALTSATPFARRSTDTGATWAATTSTLAASGSASAGIRFASNLWVATNGQDIYHSGDGANWTTTVSGNLAGVAFSGTVFAIGNASTVNTTIAVTSPPTPVSWTNRTYATTFVHSATAGGNGGIACGGGGGGGTTNDSSSSGAGGAGGNGLVRVYAW